MMRVMISKVFLSFIQRRGIGNALRALCTRQGINDEMRWADQSLIHSGCSLDGDELVHERLVYTAAKLAQGGGQHKVVLRGVDTVLTQASRIHDSKVGAQLAADLVIGGAQCMLEDLEGQQDADRHRSPPPCGRFRETCSETLLNGMHQSVPREGIGPLPNGIAVRNEVRHVQGGADTTQPMLKRVHKTHLRLS